MRPPASPGGFCFLVPGYFRQQRFNVLTQTPDGPWTDAFCVDKALGDPSLNRRYADIKRLCDLGGTDKAVVFLFSNCLSHVDMYELNALNVLKQGNWWAAARKKS